MDIFHDMLSSVRRSLCESPDVIVTPEGESLNYTRDKPSLAFILWNDAVWVGNGNSGQMHDDLSYYISECWDTNGTTDPDGKEGFENTYKELRPPKSMDSTDSKRIRNLLQGGPRLEGLVTGRALQDSKGVWYVSFWDNHGYVVAEGRSGMEVVANYLGGEVRVELWDTGDRRKTGAVKDSDGSTPLAVPLDAYLSGKLNMSRDVEHRVLRPE